MLLAGTCQGSVVAFRYRAVPLGIAALTGILRRLGPTFAENTLVTPAPAQSRTGLGTGQDGVPALLAGHRVAVDPDAVDLLSIQIVRGSRWTVYRILGYNGWLKDFFAMWEDLRHTAPG
jgi:hypothetical protein